MDIDLWIFLVLLHNFYFLPGSLVICLTCYMPLLNLRAFYSSFPQNCITSFSYKNCSVLAFGLKYELNEITSKNKVGQSCLDNTHPWQGIPWLLHPRAA